MLTNFRIVLVRTTHAGNIGATARAMKTMGLSELYLVSPEDFPNVKATARASGAADILSNAIVVNSLTEAIADCRFVAGTSTRQRTIPWPHLSLADSVPILWQEALSKELDLTISTKPTKVAIVFGREEHGLTNAELALCTQHISIDANEIYPVMNLAAAVQVVCYELRQQYLKSLKSTPSELSLETLQKRAMQGWDKPCASMQELENFYHHFEQTLIDLNYFKSNNPEQLMTRVRRLFNRARPDKLEIGLLRGMLSLTQKAVMQTHTQTTDSMNDEILHSHHHKR